MTIPELSAMVAELKKKREAATPGPWKVGPINYADIYGPDGDVILLVTKGRTTTVGDAALMVSVPNALPTLLSAAETLAKIAEMPCARPLYQSKDRVWCGRCGPCIARATIEGMGKENRSA